VSSRIHAITVYCSSSSDIAPAHFDAGRQLGAAIARNGWTLVYGGNRIGLMGTVADAAREAGGKVVGITPQLLVDHGIADEHCDELVVTAGMRERKALLEQRANAFIALPGGLGTFEEIFEIIVGRVLGVHDKPIVLLNVDNYYGPLLAAIEHGIAQHFIRPKARRAYFVADTVEAAIAHVRNSPQIAPSPASPASAEPSALE
jgi:cytokinin riboside 5'-monophosphate phosphoribohydrolase